VRATIKGFEVMRMFRKGQFRFWIEAVGAKTEVSFINHLFGSRSRAKPSRVQRHFLQQDGYEFRGRLCRRR
jgi:hypothetical protein